MERVPESEFPGTNFEEVHGDLREADFCPGTVF
jgi:hypothetical protein